MKKVIAVLILVLLFASTVFAASATLTWNANLTRSDGTTFALNQITAYTIYYGTGAGCPPSKTNTNTVKVNLPITTAYPSLSIMTYTIDNLLPQTSYCFAVSETVKDDPSLTTTQESNLSNIVTKMTPTVAPPSAPVNITVVTAGVS